ncbi:hypothetical protein Y032_0726g1866 [Ancylostoma ceylanicum]|uniref:Uncharacterized protein n=1 Tax=Ancylostoma ceylanicum TaxID=53326 RepID=A0A016WEM2_9BILA|nr:hypothetical protein Y032_0726g1866 [Ancylostoma ceylanicum]
MVYVIPSKIAEKPLFRLLLFGEFGAPATTSATESCGVAACRGGCEIDRQRLVVADFPWNLNTHGMRGILFVVLLLLVVSTEQAPSYDSKERSTRNYLRCLAKECHAGAWDILPPPRECRWKCFKKFGTTDY